MSILCNKHESYKVLCPLPLSICQRQHVGKKNSDRMSVSGKTKVPTKRRLEQGVFSWEDITS